MATKLNKQEFIKRSTEKHGGKYDYSSSEYVNSTTKVVIVCPVHGRFEQRPADHMKGCGCWKCRNQSIFDRSRLNKNDFIERAKEIHNNKYDYRKVIYTTTETPVVVVCPIHGNFKIRPHSHIGQKQGCNKCGIIQRAESRTKTQVEFIADALQVHGDKYFYEKVVYEKAMKQVIITCPLHGDFEQRPVNHLQGRGCPVCGGSQPLDAQKFIVRARQIHGDRFDYSQVNYINSSTPVLVICREHGPFYPTPSKHMRGGGCATCSGVNKHTQDQFVALASVMHKGKYDYSKAVYEHGRCKLTIICPKHGEFQQRAYYHLQGHGCDQCGGTAKLTRSQFVESANIKYNARYDYSKVTDFENAKTKVEIGCPVHGLFRQSPTLHLREESVGCPECGQLQSIKNRSLGTEIFIKRSVVKHGDKYIYDKVAYTHVHAKVVITCKIHGDFHQVAHTHLEGSGCPVCYESSGERDVRVYLENNKIPHKQERYIRGIGWFDFVVKTKSGLGVIEFQGHQHYFPVDFGSKQENAGLKILENNVVRDNRKEQWCLKKGYFYLAVPYWDQSRVSEILDGFFSGRIVEASKPPVEVEKYNEHRKMVLFNLTRNE